MGWSISKVRKGTVGAGTGEKTKKRAGMGGKGWDFTGGVSASTGFGHHPPLAKGKRKKQVSIKSKKWGNNLMSISEERAVWVREENKESQQHEEEKKRRGEEQGSEK